ncbi:MAG: hypothetical protein ACKVP5_21440 [Aestuariivirga sp.]
MLACFLTAYAAAAVAFQLISKIPPWVDGAPVDIMNGTLIWMTCLIALMMSFLTSGRGISSLIWLAGSAALGVVALDEMFGMHEHASKIRDDDDPKILMAIGAGVALTTLVRVEKIRGAPLALLIIGFVIHCLYLLSDLGDGDFLDLTFGNPDGLRILEEVLEFSAMSAYLAAFVLVLLRHVTGYAVWAAKPSETRWQERLGRIAGAKP